MSWRRRAKVKVLTGGALLGVGLLGAGLADARPGGGHSYSGSSYSGSSYSGSSYSGYGGSSYSGGGGGGGGCGLFGSMLMVGAIIVAGAVRAGLDTQTGWESSPDAFEDPPPIPPMVVRPLPWKQLHAIDPEFSHVVFEDFVFRLYASMHEARGDTEAMAALAPYAAPEVREAFMGRRPKRTRISKVVVGSMRVTELRFRAEQVALTVVFESNVSAEDEGTTWYLRERWDLVRDRSVRSKPPEAVRALRCPNCAAPFESADEQRCDYCGEVVVDGRFDWFISASRLLEAKPTPPALGGYAPEVGTKLRTLSSPSIFSDLEQLRADDPALSLDELGERIALVHERLNTAWVARDLSPARPFLSAGIHDYLRYWVDAYRRQELINCLDDARLENVEFVKLTRDRYFDAVTVRVHASGFDYTIRESNEQLVGGSKRQRRAYTEYWTFIRGATVRGPARHATSCPNCGAPLVVNMAGNCEHCSAHLTRGEFDWVLSKIEQDESYRG